MSWIQEYHENVELLANSYHEKKERRKWNEINEFAQLIDLYIYFISRDLLIIISPYTFYDLQTSSNGHKSTNMKLAISVELST